MFIKMFSQSALHLLLSFPLFFEFSSAVPASTPYDDTTVSVEQARENLEKRSIYFTGWKGCNQEQQDNVTLAWNQMLSMANRIKGNIVFSEQVSFQAYVNPEQSSDPQAQMAVDFLGDPARNSEYQDNIRGETACLPIWP